MTTQTIPRQHPPKLWKLWLEVHAGSTAPVPNTEDWFRGLLMKEMNASVVARRLGVGHATVYRWMDWYGLEFAVHVQYRDVP